MNEKCFKKIFFFLVIISFHFFLYAAGSKEPTSPSPALTPPLTDKPAEDTEIIESQEINEMPGQQNEEPLFSSDEDISINLDITEVSYINSQNKFRMLEYDGEVLDVTFNKEGGIASKVLAEGKRVVIKSYDSLMRVIEHAEFSQETGKNLLTKKITFLYDEKSQFPAESTEIDYVRNEKIHCNYNNDGFVIFKKMYTGSYALSLSQIGEDTLKLQEKYSYDEKNRITEYVKKSETGEIREVNFYTKEFPNPDKKLFIDSVLREEITYTDEDGNPCAKMGLTNATKGTGWKIVKDFKGQLKHSQGGVDITISDKGVTMRRGGKDIKAKYGLLIINNN